MYLLLTLCSITKNSSNDVSSSGFSFLYYSTLIRFRVSMCVFTEYFVNIISHARNGNTDRIEKRKKNAEARWNDIKSKNAFNCADVHYNGGVGRHIHVYVRIKSIWIGLLISFWNTKLMRKHRAIETQQRQTFRSVCVWEIAYYNSRFFILH